VRSLPSSLRRSILATIGLVVLTGCGGSHVRISVGRPVALWDSPLRIVVTGLKPGEHAELRARSGDWFGARFASVTPVTANSNGRVELSGEAALRPLWSLRQVGSVSRVGHRAPAAMAIDLSIAGARTTIRRLVAAPGVHGVPIRHPFFGEYYAPKDTAHRRPGVLVFGGSEGGLSTQYIAMLYASHGYPSLALAYFGDRGLPRNLHRIPLEYFANALRWLQRQPGVAADSLAVEGISRGSEAAQLLGIHYPRLVHGVIAMVPSNGAVCGIERLGATCIGAAWTLRGRAIPFADIGSQYTPYPFPDERIRGPIFLDCAGADQLWPSCPMAQAIVQRLHGHHFQHEITFVDYPDAGHGVGALYPNTFNASAGISGLHLDSNDRAAASGWPKLLSFLHRLDR
jgi:dienelactone hydrolase